MALVLTREAELRMLRGLLGQPLALRLFANDVTPTATGPALEEVALGAGGYRPLRVEPSEWTAEAGAADMGARSEEHVFVFTGDVPQVCGYYLTPADEPGVVLMAERLDGPPLRPRAEDSLSVSVRCGLAEAQ